MLKEANRFWKGRFWHRTRRRSDVKINQNSVIEPTHELLNLRKPLELHGMNDRSQQGGGYRGTSGRFERSHAHWAGSFIYPAIW